MPNRHRALLLALCLLSAGCVVSIPSEPGAANVTMTHKEADVASCTVLGDVQGLTDDNYVRDERREMQNETVELRLPLQTPARQRESLTHSQSGWPDSHLRTVGSLPHCRGRKFRLRRSCDGERGDSHVTHTHSESIVP
jgi:hypothetical protein